MRQILINVICRISFMSANCPVNRHLFLSNLRESNVSCNVDKISVLNEMISDANVTLFTCSRSLFVILSRRIEIYSSLTNSTRSARTLNSKLLVWSHSIEFANHLSPSQVTISVKHVVRKIVYDASYFSKTGYRCYH